MRVRFKNYDLTSEFFLQALTLQPTLILLLCLAPFFFSAYIYNIYIYIHIYYIILYFYLTFAAVCDTRFPTPGTSLEIVAAGLAKNLIRAKLRLFFYNGLMWSTKFGGNSLESLSLMLAF